MIDCQGLSKTIKARVRVKSLSGGYKTWRKHTIGKPTFTNFPFRTEVLKLHFAVFKECSYELSVSIVPNLMNRESTAVA